MVQIKIAFTGSLGSLGHNNSQIYTMNADGTGVTRIASNSYEDYYPVWSPDGTKIAFRSGRNDQDNIYVMNIDGEGQTNLTIRKPEGFSPDWKP